MFEILLSLNLSAVDWSIAFFCAVLVGFAKTGIGGVGILIVPLMASIFPAKISVGVLLPMLCIADIFAVKYYHRHADWSLMLKPIPWAVMGILIGVWVGKDLDTDAFRYIIGSIILSILVFMIFKEYKKNKNKGEGKKNYKGWMFGAVIGLLGGFTTMVGNAAGPIWAVYLLAMKLPKYAYIGTGAWFFLILNHFKVPFHIFVWKTITWQTFCFNLVMIPGIIVGAFLGIYTIKRIDEKSFRQLILFLAAIASLKLLTF